MSLFDRALAGLMPFVPRSIVGRVAKRYVAGETLAEAMAAVRDIEARGACATMDVLGEEIRELAEAEVARKAYLDVLDRIAETGADANISIKLTAFGLRLDQEQCYANVKTVVERASELGNFVRIDMEDSTTTSDTLALYRRLREAGHDNVGVVLQAYMRRSMADVEALTDLVAHYRLCKGIYVEREEVAIQDGGEINDNFLKLLDAMFERRSYVGIATHDRALVEGAQALIEKHSLAPDQYEFQMLLGVQEGLGREILDAGHKLRIYVPYGPDWYAYCVRRLKENPRIGRYVFLAMFRGGR